MRNIIQDVKTANNKKNIVSLIEVAAKKHLIDATTNKHITNTTKVQQIILKIANSTDM